MKMVLNTEKAAALLQSLDAFYKNRLLSSRSRILGKSLRYKQYANMIIARYGYVLLIDKNGKYLCNNPRYLKQWAALKPNIKELPMVAPNCDRFFKTITL